MKYLINLQAAVVWWYLANSYMNMYNCNVYQTPCRVRLFSAACRSVVNVCVTNSMHVARWSILNPLHSALCRAKYMQRYFNGTKAVTCIDFLFNKEYPNQPFWQSVLQPCNDLQYLQIAARSVLQIVHKPPICAFFARVFTCSAGKAAQSHLPAFLHTTTRHCRDRHQTRLYNWDKINFSASTFKWRLKYPGDEILNSRVEKGPCLILQRLSLDLITVLSFKLLYWGRPLHLAKQ